MSGMNKRIWVGLSAVKLLCPITPTIPLVLVGRLPNASGQTETNLYWFGGIDGSSPEFGLVQGHDGNFYGVTVGGATQTVCSGHCGTIFKISPSGSLTNLYWFSGGDGTSPSWLVQGSDGNFYGTAAYGGTNGCNCGTVFQISPGGSYTSLHSFGPDGQRPVAALVQGSDGNFYGTTQRGGRGGGGIAFRISPSGSFTNLHSFGSADGNQLVNALTQGTDG